MSSNHLDIRCRECGDHLGLGTGFDRAHQDCKLLILLAGPLADLNDAMNRVFDTAIVEHGVVDSKHAYGFKASGWASVIDISFFAEHRGHTLEIVSEWNAVEMVYESGTFKALCGSWLHGEKHCMRLIGHDGEHASDL